MKSNNHLVLFSALLLMSLILVLFPISANPVLAAPPHPCFGNTDPECLAICTSDPEKLQASCCWQTADLKYACQTCEVNGQTGDYENCYYPKIGISDDNIVNPQPPSGVAPPPSSEICSENTVIDEEGNCTPITQSPEELAPPSSSPEEQNQSPKSQLPRGSIIENILPTEQESESAS